MHTDSLAQPGDHALLYGLAALVCVDALHLSEDAAYKRIQAARAARQYPQSFAAVADGRRRRGPRP